MRRITDLGGAGAGLHLLPQPRHHASDDVYTKVVARRMLQMTAHINAEWKRMSQATGVTCYTCHRGQPVPANAWARNDTRRAPLAFLSAPRGAWPAPRRPDLAALRPLHPLFSNDAQIRLRTRAPRVMPVKPGPRMRKWTYGLMMHMSTSLGVNCTYCHNSRAWYSWEESPPQRTNAWHGIRMVRDINNNFIDPAAAELGGRPLRAGQWPHPAARRHPWRPAEGEFATCHQGAYKPLLGSRCCGTIRS